MIRLALLTTEEAALMLGKSAYTLKQDRHRMRGLPYIKFNNGQIKYLLTDVEDALAGAKGQGGDDAAQKDQTGPAPPADGQGDPASPHP